ncbi:MAG: phage baseplate assembly protein V [Pseudomonadota bacterium]
MIEIIHKLTEDMRGKVRLMVGRAILAAISDAGAIQTAQAQLLADETHDDMERIQEYGFTSVPLPGAEGVAVFVGGNRDHGLIIATDDRRCRKKDLQGGEVALYTDEGDCIVLNRGRVVRIVAGAQVEVTAPVVTLKAATKVRMETPLLEVTGDIKDKCDTTGKTMAGMRTTYNTHTHPGDSGGTTGTPNQGM